MSLELTTVSLIRAGLERRRNQCKDNVVDCTCSAIQTPSDAFWTSASGGIVRQDVPVWSDTMHSGNSVSCFQDCHRQAQEFKGFYFLKYVFVKAVQVTMQMCLQWLAFDTQAADITYHTAASEAGD